MPSPGLEHEALVAIGTFHKRLVPHLQPDARMAKRAAAAVTGDAGILGFDDFRGFDSHGAVPKIGRKLEIGRIIAAKI